jgi:hypothetical protein
MYIEIQHFCTRKCTNNIILFSAQYATIFEQDLSQLIKNLKEFTFLEIFGEIPYEKVESYRLMAQALFPYSQVDVGRSRFQLWL